jgi:hypothetical protein
LQTVAEFTKNCRSCQQLQKLPTIAEVANNCRSCQQLQKLPIIAEVANNCRSCQQLQKLPTAAVVAAVAEKGCNSGFKSVIAENQKTITDTNFKRGPRLTKDRWETIYIKEHSYFYLI